MNDESGFSAEIKISTFGVMLENLKATFLDHLTRQDKALERIEAKLTIQNGRVGKSEEEIRNLQRLQAEATVMALSIQEKQSADHRELSRVKARLWKWGWTITILSALGTAGIWSIEHGILSFEPQNYHATAE